MDKPTKKLTAHPRIVIGSAAAAVAVCLLAAAILITNNGILATMTGFFQKTSSSDSSAVSDSAPEDSLLPDGGAPALDAMLPASATFAHPDQMRGAWLVAGTDYALSAGDTGETVKAQIDAAFASLAQWNWNTVIVPLWVNDKPLYATKLQPFGSRYQSIKNADGTDFDPVAYIQQSAKARGIYAYGVLDLRIGIKDGWDPTTPDGAKAIRDMAAEAASLYPLDGYLLGDTGYASGSGGSFIFYMQQAPGAGFDTYLRDSVTASVNDAIHAIKAADPNLYVGLLAESVWAHAASNEKGSQTSGAYESYVDGYADTLGWMQDGYFDFVMVKDEQATTDGAVPFDTVLKWWTSACGDKGIPLYISHAAGKVGGSEAGWQSPDQLAQQVLACKKATGWTGSAFNSISALQKDSSGSTNAILAAFGDSLNEEYITRTLTVSSPTKTTFTTYESTVSIRGSADPDFPLTMNGQNVAMTEHGFFSMDLNLSLGENTFTFAHKGQTVTYKITYKVVVLKSVEPSSKLALDGGTSISISATAYKGSKVYAKINGTTVEMNPAPVQQDESDTQGDQSDYVNYSGEYTLPDGVVGKEQDLGAVTVYGSYQSMSESKEGGHVVVNALQPPPPESSEPTAPPDTGSTQPAQPVDPGDGGAVLASGKIVTINRSYAETFSGSTTDDWSRPVNAYLPYGTTDVVVKNVYDSASGSYYYLLGCGQRVYQSNASVMKSNGDLTANTLGVGAVGADSEETKITLDASWLIPYTARLLPQSYGNEATQNYNITDFTADHMDITFFYTTGVNGTPDVSSSPLFSSAEWIDNGNHSFTLRLHFRSAGTFYGYSVLWGTDNGKPAVTFTFPNPTGAASGNKPLAGKRIVIDPGHGGNSVGTAGGNVAEKTLTLKYGLMLRDKLEALGATVVMTRTTDVNPDNTLNPPSLDARTAFARNNGTDLFLSIHMDGTSSSSARGYTVYYFNEYSQPYAKALAGRIDTVYKSFTGGSGRGYKWNNFSVMRLHDCPALLIECGFMSNSDDLELLISNDYQDKLTQAMADGMVDYFRNRTAYSVQVSASTTASAAMTTASVPVTVAAMAIRRKKRKAA